jgi:hypothetical protein
MISFTVKLKKLKDWLSAINSKDAKTWLSFYLGQKTLRQTPGYLLQTYRMSKSKEIWSEYYYITTKV